MVGHSLGDIFTMVFLAAFALMVGGFALLSFVQALFGAKWKQSGVALVGVAVAVGAGYGAVALW